MAIAISEARSLGAEVTEVDLHEVRFPHFSLDDEARDGLPEVAVWLKRELAQHQGLLIAAPELNGSFCTTLKAALDWGSRPAPNGDPTLTDFRGKVAGILSGSKWDHAGLRGLGHLRTVLSELGVILIPESVSLPHAREAFDSSWQTKDPKYGEQARKLGRELVFAIRKFSPEKVGS